jgi:hypothetical protein
MATDYSSISIGSAEDLAKRVGDNLLADRYRDPTHFVYELLQNAEDALKDRLKEQPKGDFNRSVRFDLFSDRLELRHFGIPFGKVHIQAICDIARSSKTAKDDIQHFGIGFKSVYAFTKSPQIHSGDEHFCIKSYVKPHLLAPRETGSGETLFVFPFDRPEKEPTECHSEIAARLRDLGLQTILFLRFVDEIDWRIDGQGSGRYTRKIDDLDAGVRKFDLSGEENGRKLRSEGWLVFHRAADFIGRDGRTIDVAFRLAERDGRSQRRQIRRVKDSRLVALFPTDVETKLGFLIQGPYELTPSREGLDGGKRARETNQRLMTETAKLVSETLAALKARGLLTISALDALPLEADEFETDLGKFFAPVFESVKQALTKRPLIPGIGKSFVSGTNGVLMRGRELAELIKPDQLKLLLGSEEERQWISPDITDKKATQRLHSYLRDVVNVDEIDADSLGGRLDDSFLSAQKHDWFRRFYRFLLKHESIWSEYSGLRDKLIIRLADGSNVTPLGSDRAANAFLPAGGEIGPKTVHPMCAKGEALSFLRKLGLRERDSVAEVLEDILPQYEAGEAPTKRKHKRNLGRIFRALGHDTSPDHHVLKEKLSGTAFLWAVNAKTGMRELKSPESLLYVKTPELREYFDSQDDCWFLAEPSLSKKSRQWVVQLGVGELPALRRTTEAEDRHWREFEPIQPLKRMKECRDRDLHGLGNALRRIRKHLSGQPTQAIKLSRIVWGIAARVADREDGRFLQGILSRKPPYHGKPKEHTFDSYFVERLQKETWLPDRKGQFRKPSAMQEQELRPDFERNRKLCEALKFLTPRSERFKQAGATADDIRWLELKERDPEAAAEFYRNYRRRSVAPSGPASARATLVSPVTAAEVNRPGDLVLPTGQNRLDRVQEPESVGASAISVTQPNAETAGAGAGRSTVAEEGDRTARTDHLQTRVRVIAGGANEPVVESQEMTALRTRVDEAGVARVKAFEKAAGRVVEELHHNHPGYDLHSRESATGDVVRYIEVKSTGSDWNGVMLSSTQFEAAQRLGEQYWLYVVENADSQEARVYPIQNPAGLSEKFIFDAGWKEISSSQQLSKGQLSHDGLTLPRVDSSALYE